MIDLHSHILPQLDDGASDLYESLEMARMAVRGGVHTMVATPHCTDDRAYEVRQAWELLHAGLREAGIPLRLKMGMELFGTWDTAQLLLEGKLFTLAGSRYPLIEFDFVSDGEGQTQILQDVIRVGYQPIVAHPERYRYVQQEPRLINRWKRMGCLFQINRCSLLGRFGGSAQRMAMELVDRGFATVIASDAHSARVRTPWMADVRQMLEEEFSPTAAQYLLRINPRRIIKNEELPPVRPGWFL